MSGRVAQLEDQSQPSSSHATAVLWWILALIPLILGFALRLRYLLQAEPYVDEPTTLLVGQAIARSGLPVLPSGLFYGNDLPFSYLAGGLVAAFGPHLEVIRFFSLAASVLTIGLLFEVGRRLVSPWAGLWAALFLALSPQAIIWGGRARAYSLLALLAFLAAWFFFLSLRSGQALSLRSGQALSLRSGQALSLRSGQASGVTDERNGQRRLGLLLLVIATFVHPEAALLLPAFVVGAWLLEGWRWFLHWDRIIELLLAVAGIGARYLLQHALSRGLIGGLETLTGSRPPLELAGDLLPRIQDVLPFFLDPQRLPWTILALVALVASGWAAIRGRRTGRDQAVLFFSTCLWLVPVIMVLFLGSTYQSPRYLNMLLPIFALLAACGLEWLVQNLAQLLPSGRWQLALGGLVTVALLAASWPGAVTASASSEKGFRSALEYVEEHWQSGDRVATVAPAYCEMVLEQCDAFILGKDYEEFVYRAGDGQWVDRWLGLPLLRTASELEDELDQGGRLWLVVDEGRLRKRFDTPFAQTVWQRMELVSNTNQAMVFLSRQGAEPAVFRLPLPEPAVLGDQVALAGYELGRATGQMADTSLGEVVAAPGQTLPLTLHWQAVGPVSGEYTVFVHLLGPDGQRYAQDDGPPLNGLQPMTHWVAGEVLPDRRVLDLPSDIAPGLYRLVIGLYEPDSGERLPITDAAGQPLGDALTLDYLRVASPGEDRVSPSTPVNADFVGNGDQIRLLGYDLPSGGNVDGDSFDLALYWQALSPVGSDYTVFVHLLDDQDQILGQGDGPPLGGYYPTSFWDPGQVVVGLHQVLIDAGAPPGTYRLAAGLYLLSTGDRLAVDGDDRLILTEVQVE